MSNYLSRNHRSTKSLRKENSTKDDDKKYANPYVRVQSRNQCEDDNLGSQERTAAFAHRKDLNYKFDTQEESPRRK